MSKKKEQAWKQQLLKALDAEAEKIEQRAKPYQAGLSEEKKEEMYQNILARIRQSEEKEGSEERTRGRKAAAAGKKGVMQRPFWKHPLKLAGVLLAVTAAVFGTSLISEANRMYWLGKWEALTGSGKVEQSNNGGDSLVTETSEMELRERAKEELGIVVPSFFYMPEDICFADGIMNLQNKRVVLNYKTSQGYLYLTIDKSDKPFVGSEITDNQETETVWIRTGEEKLEIFLSEYTEANLIVQEGKWVYENCQYTFSGVISREEFREILVNMNFVFE